MTFIASAITLATTASGQAVHKYRDGFAKYASVQAVAGREARFVEFLKSLLPPGAKADTDNMGDLPSTMRSGLARADQSTVTVKAAATACLMISTSSFGCAA